MNEWAYHVKSMLEIIGLNYLWTDQQTNEIYLPVIKQRILDHYYLAWYGNINNSERLSSYCRYKHTFNEELYLDAIHERKIKIPLSRFRSSSHNLEIERGR